MLYTKQLCKAAALAALALALTFNTSIGFAEEKSEPPIATSVDPLTGEIKKAPKLLSEMTEEERAKLTDKEIKALEELEAATQLENQPPKY